MLPGAFAAMIPTFRRNPVLLVNHRNDVSSLAGNFTLLKEDEKGLYVEASITNSPHPDMVDLPVRTAEGCRIALG